MLDINRLVETLRRHEGVRTQAYDDANGETVIAGSVVGGKITVGVGRNLIDKGLSDSEINYLLQDDISDAAADVLLAFPFVRELDGPRQEVLINMCFNMGIGNLKGFERMWAAIERRDYLSAAAEMLDSLWAEQVGDRATELAGVMELGDWP